ncbi:MAG: hypothetical protein ACOYLU_08230 [Limisphaerales bacterium]
MSAGSGAPDHSDELLDDQQLEQLKQDVIRARRAEEQRLLQAELKELEQRKRDFARHSMLPPPNQPAAPKRASTFEFATPTAKKARTVVGSAAKVIEATRPGLGTVNRVIRSPQRDAPNPTILKVLKASEQARIRDAATGPRQPPPDDAEDRGDGEDRADDGYEDDGDRSQPEVPLREPHDQEEPEDAPSKLVYLGGTDKVQAHPFVAESRSEALPFYKAPLDSNDTGTSKAVSIWKLAKDVPSVAGISPLPRLKRDADGETILRQIFTTSTGSTAKYSAKSEEYKADEKNLTDLIHLHKGSTSLWNHLEHIVRPAEDVKGDLAPEILISDQEELRGAVANAYKEAITIQTMLELKIAELATAMTAKIMADCGVPQSEIPKLTRDLHKAAIPDKEKTFTGSVEAMRAYERLKQNRIDTNSNAKLIAGLLKPKKNDFFDSRSSHTRGRGGRTNRGRGAKPSQSDSAQGQQRQQQQQQQRGRGSFQNRGRGGRGQARQQPDSNA